MTQGNYAADMQRALKGGLASPNAAEGFQSTFPTLGICAIGRCVFCRLLQGDASGEPHRRSTLSAREPTQGYLCLGETALSMTWI